MENLGRRPRVNVRGSIFEDAIKQGMINRGIEKEKRREIFNKKLLKLVEKYSHK